MTKPTTPIDAPHRPNPTPEAFSPIAPEPDYVHGYSPQEGARLMDQASTLAELLHFDTAYPAGSLVLEAGCGVGAQTVTLAPQQSAGAQFRGHHT